MVLLYADQLEVEMGKSIQNCSKNDRRPRNIFKDN